MDFQLRLSINLTIESDAICFLLMTFPPRILDGSTTVKQKHDSFALNSLISTVLTVECFLEVILLIYRFKRVNFLFENGTLES